MASFDDAYNQLVDANSHLGEIHTDLQTVNTSVQATTAAVQSGFSTLESLVNFEIEQNWTIICNLEKISKQTCELVNQATRQTIAEEAMREEISDIKQLYEIAQPAAAVEQHRLEELERKVEECCPPPAPQPVCVYEPCPKPEQGPPKRTRQAAR